MTRFAAPAPKSTVRVSLTDRRVSVSALIRPATVAAAVPSWSSCQTGISSRFVSSSRMAKHFGEAMSSRLIPPNAGEIPSTVFMNAAGLEARIGTGMASTPPRNLNRSAFPSITGRAAAGPTSPRPRTRVPSVAMATVFQRPVSSKTSSGSAWIARETWATPGEYQSEKSCIERTGTFGTVSIFPP